MTNPINPFYLAIYERDERVNKNTCIDDVFVYYSKIAIYLA